MPNPQAATTIVENSAVTIAQTPVMRTSLADDVAPEALFEFARWTMYANTAYQRGQQAGFSRGEANALHKRGFGHIVSNRFVTK